MKKIKLFLSVALLFMAVATQAQRGQMSPEKMAEFKTKYKTTLQDSLQIAEPMADSIANIDFAYQTSVRELFQNQDISREDKMAKIKDLKTQKDNTVKGLLPEATFEKYLSMEKNARYQMRPRRRNQDDSND
jgi:hypothetical protein